MNENDTTSSSLSAAEPLNPVEQGVAPPMSATPSLPETATTEPALSLSAPLSGGETSVADMASTMPLSAADTATTTATNPYGLESLIANGDIIIQVVAAILLLMSVFSWYIILTRGMRNLYLSRAASRAKGFWHARNLKEGMRRLGGKTVSNPFLFLAHEAVNAREHHVACGEELHGQLSLSDWLSGCLRAAMDENAERMRSGLSVLASVGSTAPFVGLFGTVWGIYHALIGIGIAGQASIDKVAGPVGEALIMTAFGLVVAIPAVLGYNMLVRSNAGIMGKLNRFSHQFHAYLVTGTPVNQSQASVTKLREAS